MSKSNNGGPAFPVAPHGYESAQCGMSLRDYFAGLAMQAIIAKLPVREGVDVEDIARECATSLGAYCYADSMLEARAK